MTRCDESIGLDAIILAIYLAVAPMHQTLVLSNGSTVVKYLALLVMVACLVRGYIANRSFIVIWDLIWPIALMFGWFVVTLLWTDSRSASISSLISTGSYCTMMLIVGSRRWNDREKRLLSLVLAFSCILYSTELIRSAATSRRATLLYKTEDADPNTVACNIGFGALTALNLFLCNKNGSGIKWPALACMFVILAGIISTGSRGGLISFLVGAVYLILAQAKMSAQVRNTIIIVAGLVLIFYWLIIDLNILQNETIVSRYRDAEISSIDGRIEIWEQYLDLLVHRPMGFLCGYGYGCDTVAHAAYMGRNWLRVSHNDLISILCQAGIPGVLLTCSFIRHIWRRSRQDHNYLGCACILLAIVSSMGINFFKTYGWWNAMILAYIGIDNGRAGQSSSLPSRSTSGSL